MTPTLSSLSQRWYPARCIALALIVGLTITASLLVTSPAEAQQGVDSIVVEGNERIEAETVRSYISISAGDPFNAEAVNRSLKTLFATGLFADVTIRREAQTLIIRVVENPIINRVAFEGNERIDDEDMAAEVQLRPRVVYTRTRVQADAQRILELYRRSGRFAATVDPKVIQLPQNRVDLAFEINEGPTTGIRRINFVGNRRFGDSVLRDEILTVESAWYKFFTSDDTYDPDRLTFDRELLRKFYLQNGYADFRVVSAVAELTPERDAFYVTFSVEEGQRYRFGGISVESHLPDLAGEALVHLLTTYTGEWYDADDVEDTIQALTDVAGDLGYAFIDIRPRINRDRDKAIVDVKFELNEGPRVYVERIDIVGNTRTLDKVLRREFRIVEGDAFNAAKIRRSRQGIQNLGFFEAVEVDTETGSGPDQSVVTVSVEEQSTGELSFGAGISSLDGVLGDISITERNMLGRGQSLRLGLTISTRRQEIDLSFTEPYFLDRNLLAGFDIFRKSADLQDVSSFDQETVGASVRLGYVLAEDLRHTLRYTLQRDEISDVDADASRFIKEQDGTTTTSSVAHSLSYDLRDNRIAPTEGFVIRFGQELAGFGGNVQFIKHTFDYGYFYPLGGGWVAGATIKEGHILGLGQDVRINNRFFLGGASLRGFESGGVGPRDLATGDSLGGNLFYSGTADISAPLKITKALELTGSVFTDIGSLTTIDDSGAEIAESGNPRMSIGFGFGYRSPFGPIRVDFAQAILKESFDETETFRFSFGTRF